jgi:pimeloyl-ACP methyl ester carboxylesterase
VNSEFTVHGAAPALAGVRLHSMGSCLSAATQNCCISAVLLSSACAVGGFKKLQNKFAFYPPNPPTYRLDEAGRLSWTYAELEDEVRHVERSGVSVSVQRVPTRTRHSLTVFRFSPSTPAGPAGRLTLLWSHGNAMDCGEMYPLLASLARELDVHICAYDYSGYGASTGTPSERTLYDDIEAVYDHLCSELDPSTELVVYGQSVGSGPSCWLCARQPARALVLQSALTSGMRVIVPDWSHCLSPVRLFSCVDIFPNHKLLPQFEGPVLLIHGTRDEVVHVRNTALLHRTCVGHGRTGVRAPHYVEGAGHDNVIEADMRGYMRLMADFLKGLAP